MREQFGVRWNTNNLWKPSKKWKKKNKRICFFWYFSAKVIVFPLSTRRNLSIITIIITTFEVLQNFHLIFIASPFSLSKISQRKKSLVIIRTKFYLFLCYFWADFIPWYLELSSYFLFSRVEMITVVQREMFSVAPKRIKQLCFSIDGKSDDVLSVPPLIFFSFLFFSQKWRKMKETEKVKLKRFALVNFV